MKTYLVSVVIPLYNAASTLNRCVDSLMTQTLESIEYIFVDDCSTDDTVRVLQEALARYPQRQSDVQILTSPEHQGTLAARLRGMQAAQGEFITQCDGDDYVEPGAYATAYGVAQIRNADIVIFNYYLERGKQRTVVNRVLPYSTGNEVIATGYLTLIEWGVVLMMMRNDHEAITRIRPIASRQITMWEDVYLCMHLFRGAQQVSYIDEPLYHYDVSRKRRILPIEAMHDCIAVATEVSTLLADDPAMDIERHWLEFVAKEQLLVHGTIAQWRATFPECHRYIGQFKGLNRRQRIVYSCLAHGFTWPYRAQEWVKHNLLHRK